MPAFAYVHISAGALKARCVTFPGPRVTDGYELPAVNVEFGSSGKASALYNGTISLVSIFMNFKQRFNLDMTQKIY